MTFQLRWPTTSPNITQPFGVNLTGIPDFYTRFGLPGHEGIDFEASEGAEVFACADGIISRISLDGNTDRDNKPYGNQIRIKHDVDEGKFETAYAHLKAVKTGLSVGDEVKAGDLIGFADNTGNSRGSHLHLLLKKEFSSVRGETSFPRDIMDPTPFLLAFGTEPAEVIVSELGPPPLPVAFNERYRLQIDEFAFRRAWGWASGGGGNARWLNLIGTLTAPYSNAEERLDDPNTMYVEKAINYLKPDNPDLGTPRYWGQGSNTFCNIFVNDITRILHCEVPNNPRNTNVFNMWTWLEQEGDANGWTMSTDGEEAQEFVNNGHVAVMIWSDKKVRDHVAIVRPGVGETENGVYYPRVAQAGRLISPDMNSKDSFGHLSTELLRFYLHD